MLSGLENPLHLALLLLILLLVFGAKRLPELGRSLGSGIRGFRESVTGAADTDHSGDSATLTEKTQSTEQDSATHSQHESASHSR